MKILILIFLKSPEFKHVMFSGKNKNISVVLFSSHVPALPPHYTSQLDTLYVDDIGFGANAVRKKILKSRYGVDVDNVPSRFDLRSRE